MNDGNNEASGSSQETKQVASTASENKPQAEPRKYKPYDYAAIIGLIIYFGAFIIFGFSSLVQMFEPTTEGEPAPESEALNLKYEVDFWLIEIELVEESRLVMMMAIIGGIGSIVYAMNSFVEYVGNIKFYAQWFPFYLSKPFIGAGLAVIFYFFVRGGFFSVDTVASDLDEGGFLALAGLIGLFSNKALAKLEEISNAIFTDPEPQRDDLEVALRKDPPQQDTSGGG